MKISWSDEEEAEEWLNAAPVQRPFRFDGHDLAFRVVRVYGKATARNGYMDGRWAVCWVDFEDDEEIPKGSKLRTLKNILIDLANLHYGYLPEEP